MSSTGPPPSDFIMCDCFNKAVESFDQGARRLLAKSKAVNKMHRLAEHTKERNKARALESIRKEPVKKKTEDPPIVGFVYNKYSKSAMPLDFEVPSLPYDNSSTSVKADRALNEDPSTIDIEPIPSAKELAQKKKKTSELKKKEKKTLPMVIEQTYQVTNQGNVVEELPMMIYLTQRCDDATFDCHMVYMNSKREKLFELDVNLNPKNHSQNVWLDKKALDALGQ